LPKNYKAKLYLEKSHKNKKAACKIVGEIETNMDIHQHVFKSFYARRFQNRKKTVKSQCLFGSAQAKAVHEIFVKSTPVDYFINILREDFSDKSVICRFFYLQFVLVFLCRRIFQKKLLIKC